MHNVDRFLKMLIWWSVGTYVFEVITGTTDSRVGNPFWLWNERIVAVIFTTELVIRWKRYGPSYLKSPFGVIDFISVFPFWAGFFVPVSWLGLVRTLRVLRLLKLFRYSRSLQLIALGFYRSLPALKSLAFAMIIAGLLCSAAIYETEKTAQPEKLGHFFDAVWFTAVTVTTVGYGDVYPVTIQGKIVAMLTFATALAIYAGIIGVLGSSFSKILEEEADPNVDPIQKFKESLKDRKKIKQLENRFSSDMYDK